MNDGSNREAADNMQNSLLASQMAEAQQESAVLCYTFTGVLEPKQKIKTQSYHGQLCVWLVTTLNDKRVYNGDDSGDGGEVHADGWGQ